MSDTAQKNQKAISDWLGDIVALEGHVEEAMDRQLKLSSNSSEVTAAIKRYHDTVRDSKKRAEQYQEQYGTTPGNPIIKAGTNLLGKAAGMIDMIRADSVSKALRDDYTAYNLLAISYTMLHTTSMALKDDATKAFAEQGLRTYAALVQDINNVIPEAVVTDLMAGEGQDVIDPGVVAKCRKTVDSIWKSTS
jgi:ferritin-like metal-binding protein YciE